MMRGLGSDRRISAKKGAPPCPRIRFLLCIPVIIALLCPPPAHPTMPHPTPFDAVLFDCDGVLVDSERITHIVLVQMLGELGWTISVDEAMGIFVGKMVKDEAARIEKHTGFRITESWLENFRARR